MAVRGKAINLAWKLRSELEAFEGLVGVMHSMILALRNGLLAGSRGPCPRQTQFFCIIYKYG